MRDINGIQIKVGMMVIKLNKTKNNAPDIQGKVVINKRKELGIAIEVDHAFYYDGTIMPNSGGYRHCIKENLNYLVVS